jgi:S1-C subfamily serine protease
LTTELIEALDLPADLAGAVVIATVPDGPADEAGLQGSEGVIETPLGNMPAGGDIITAIDGQPVTGMDDLITYLVDKRPGEAVTLSLYRADGEISELIVVLGARPDSVR